MWNHFEQFQPARRVKKVHPQEMPLETFAAPFRQCLNWQAGGIGGDDSMLGADGINSLEEISFDIEILDDDFND